MTRKTDEKYSKEESQKRFEAALRGGLNTPPTPLKSMTPKRTKAQPAKRKEVR
jgi:hypothetical protein